jgi:hypothetical protein
MDVDLLTIVAKRYDPILWTVKNHSGDHFFKITIEEIREVFILNPNISLHEKIDLDDL